MESETSTNYCILCLEVVPLVLKVYGAIRFVDTLPEVNYGMKRLLDKVEGGNEKFPIPENFHQSTHDVPLNHFRYDLEMTYRDVETPYPLIDKFPELTDLWSLWGEETIQTKVFWCLTCPERLSPYDIECIVKQYGDDFPPEGFPYLVDFKLRGFWKGV